MNPKVFACKNKDIDIRMDSTSGGVFTVLAMRMLQMGGKVYGVYWNEDSIAEFCRVDSVEQLFQLRGSKYAQAYLGNTFENVKKDLESGPVLFTGTPCQVQGLKSFLGEDYENLICLDFICLGVASPGVWDAYLNENFKGKKIKYIRFKDKINGWHNFTTVIKTEEEEISTLGIENPYMSSYLSYNNIRPSCYKCRFKGVEGRKSDITISDCWGIEYFAPGFDDNKGVSAVFINTKKGNKIWHRCQEYVVSKKILFEDAIRYNPYYLKKVEIPPQRALFWQKYYSHGFNRAVRTVRRKTYLEGLDISIYIMLKKLLKRKKKVET